MIYPTSQSAMVRQQPGDARVKEKRAPDPSLKQRSDLLERDYQQMAQDIDRIEANLLALQRRMTQQRASQLHFSQALRQAQR